MVSQYGNNRKNQTHFYFVKLVRNSRRPLGILTTYKKIICVNRGYFYA